MNLNNAYRSGPPSPPAYAPRDSDLIKGHDLDTIPASEKQSFQAPQTTTNNAEIRKPLIVELQLCDPNGLTRPGYIRSGKALRRCNDAITFTSSMSYPTLRNLVVNRASERGILPAENSAVEKQVMALLVRADGSSSSVATRLDEISWEAGRELLLGREGASLLFVCAVVRHEYEGRELKKLERKKGKGKKCVVM